MVDVKVHWNLEIQVHKTLRALVEKALKIVEVPPSLEKARGSGCRPLSKHNKSLFAISLDFYLLFILFHFANIH